MLNNLCRTLEAQGTDGVPKANDKGWGVMGPLGAAQRSILVTSRHAKLCAASRRPALAGRAPPQRTTTPPPPALLRFPWPPPCRQLLSLWERLEACKQEVLVLSQRLEAELSLMARLQDELHVSRANVSRLVLRLGSPCCAGKPLCGASLFVAGAARPGAQGLVTLRLGAWGVLPAGKGAREVGHS